MQKALGGRSHLALGPRPRQFPAQCVLCQVCLSGSFYQRKRDGQLLAGGQIEEDVQVRAQLYNHVDIFSICNGSNRASFFRPQQVEHHVIP